MLEHPGTPSQPDRPSISKTRLWRLVCMAGCCEVNILQGLYGARSAKPTCLSFTPSRPWLKAVLAKHQIRSVVPQEVGIGKGADGAFLTSFLKEYPAALNAALADTFHVWASELPPARAEPTPLPADIRELFRHFEVRDEASMGPDFAPPNARLIHPA